MPVDKLPFGPQSDPARLVNMALKFTGGNLDKARKMAAGKFNDAAVIKGRFSIDSKGIYGIFMIFLNLPGRYILNINALIVPSASITEAVRIFDSWKFYYADFIKFVEREGEQANSSYDFTNHVADSLDGYDIYTDVENSAPERVTSSLREIIGKFYGAAPSNCQIEMEISSSLFIELEGIPVEVRGAGSGEDFGKSDREKKIEEIEKQADFVIPGKVIVAPVKGKYINDVSIGENIRLQLVNQDQVSLKVASLLNALTEEGDFLPVKGRVKEKVPQEKSGYIIYALVAKNVLAKIVEDENVKIEMEGSESEDKQDGSDGKLILYVVLLVGLFLIALMVIVALF